MLLQAQLRSVYQPKSMSWLVYEVDSEGTRSSMAVGSDPFEAWLRQFSPMQA